MTFNGQGQGLGGFVCRKGNELGRVVLLNIKRIEPNCTIYFILSDVERATSMSIRFEGSCFVKDLSSIGHMLLLNTNTKFCVPSPNISFDLP